MVFWDIVGLVIGSTGIWNPLEGLRIRFA